MVSLVLALDDIFMFNMNSPQFGFFVRFPKNGLWLQEKSYYVRVYPGVEFSALHDELCNMTEKCLLVDDIQVFSRKRKHQKCDFSTLSHLIGESSGFWLAGYLKCIKSYSQAFRSPKSKHLRKSYDDFYKITTLASKIWPQDTKLAIARHQMVQFTPFFSQNHQKTLPNRYSSCVKNICAVP